MRTKNLLFVCLLAWYSAVSAQDRLPIQNLGVLKAYALSQAVQAELFFSGSAMVPRGYQSVWFNSPSYGWHNDFPQFVVDNDWQGLLHNINAHRASFEMTRIEPLWVGATLRNKDLLVLFGSWSREIKLSPADVRDGAYTFNTSLKFELAQEVALPFQNVAGARAVVRRSDGTVLADRTLNVHSGYIMYPTNIVGRAGELIVQTKGYGTQVFNLFTGTRQATSSVVGSVFVGVDGLYDFTGQYRDTSFLGGFVNEPRGAVLVAEFSSDTAAIIVPESAPTKWAVRPIGYLVRHADIPPNEPWLFFKVPESGRIDHGFGPGTWIIVYVLPGDNLDNILVIFPGDGGKG